MFTNDSSGCDEDLQFYLWGDNKENKIFTVTGSEQIERCKIKYKDEILMYIDKPCMRERPTLQNQNARLAMLSELTVILCGGCRRGIFTPPKKKPDRRLFRTIREAPSFVFERPGPKHYKDSSLITILSDVCLRRQLNQNQFISLRIQFSQL